MKLKLKEDPKEWRKTTLLSALGLAILSSLLRWRHILPLGAWVGTLVVLGGVMMASILQPRWFRGYYRVSSRLGFWISQFIGQGVLVVIFLLVLTPMGLALRLLGKDPLQLKRPQAADTYWSPARKNSPLERLF